MACIGWDSTSPCHERSGSKPEKTHERKDEQFSFCGSAGRGLAVQQNVQLFRAHGIRDANSRASCGGSSGSIADQQSTRKTRRRKHRKPNDEQQKKGPAEGTFGPKFMSRHGGPADNRWECTETASISNFYLALFFAFIEARPSIFQEEFFSIQNTSH